MTGVYNGQKWGNWIFDEAQMCLTYQNGQLQYYVPLRTCTDSPHILDWIAQLAEKTWCTPDDLGNLVKALDELLRLHSVCGEGVDRSFDPVRAIAGQRRLAERLEGMF